MDEDKIWAHLAEEVRPKAEEEVIVCEKYEEGPIIIEEAMLE